jgi:glycosyltransferase involved in cell wall biosynthesis
MVFFSVVTVCFNSDKTLTDTFDSVLSQSYSDFEYIVIDGQSTDKSVEIIKIYQKKFHARGIGFRYVSEPDSGIYSAFNKGILMSSGNFIAILNSDDVFKSEVLSRAHSIISSNASFEIFHGEIELIDRDKKCKPIVKTPIVSVSRLFWIEMSIYHPTLFISRRLYSKYIYDESFKIVADYKFVMRLLLDGHQFFNFNFIVVQMRLGGASSLFLPRIFERFHACRQLGFKFVPCFVSSCLRITFTIISKLKSIYKYVRHQY